MTKNEVAETLEGIARRVREGMFGDEIDRDEIINEVEDELPED